MKTLFLQRNENVLLCTLVFAKSDCNHCTLLQHLVHEARGRAERESVVTSMCVLLVPVLDCSPVPARHHCLLSCSRCSDGSGISVGKST